jgi:sugar phosphate isomerase/epimerase
MCLLEEYQLKRIGITLDTGHICMSKKDGPIHCYDKPAYYPYGSIAGFIKRFGKKIYNLHVHDYDGHKDHISLGEGNIDFKAITKSLKEIEYEGALTFEIDIEDRKLIEKNKSKLEELLT